MSNQKLENYQAVLADLINERNELDSHITWMEAKIHALGGNDKLVPMMQNNTIPIKLKPFEPRPPGTSNNDLCEIVLKTKGVPLHAKEILAGILQHGKTSTVKSLTGSMPQDKKRRFENLGNNTWALTAWPEEVKKRFRIRTDGGSLYDIATTG